MQNYILILFLACSQFVYANEDFTRELTSLIQDAEDNYSKYQEGMMETESPDWKEKFTNINLPYVKFDARIDQYRNLHTNLSTTIMSNDDAISEKENMQLLLEGIRSFSISSGYQIKELNESKYTIDFVVINMVTKEDVAFIVVNMRFKILEIHAALDVEACMASIEKATEYSFNDFKDIKSNLEITENGVDYYNCTKSFTYFNHADIGISPGYPQLGLYIYYYPAHALAHQMNKEKMCPKGMKKSKDITIPKNAIFYRKFKKKKRTVEIYMIATEDGEPEVYIQAGSK